MRKINQRLYDVDLLDGYWHRIKHKCFSFLFSFIFLLQVATKTLPFYNDYFSVPYPLPKIDLIAIADFAAGE